VLYHLASLLSRQLLVEVQTDELVDHDPDRGGLGGQLGQHEPAVLEAADRLAESPALLGVSIVWLSTASIAAAAMMAIAIRSCGRFCIR
jgi:hypothetical protein